MDNPDGHCGLLFFSQEQRPLELFTAVNPAGQVDTALHLHVSSCKVVPGLQEGHGQLWMEINFTSRTCYNLHLADITLQLPYKIVYRICLTAYASISAN